MRHRIKDRITFRPCVYESGLEERVLLSVVDVLPSGLTPPPVAVASFSPDPAAPAPAQATTTGEGTPAGAPSAVQGPGNTDVLSVGSSAALGVSSGRSISVSGASVGSGYLDYTAFQAASNLAVDPTYALRISGVVPVNTPGGPLPGVLGTPHSVLGMWGYPNGLGNGFYEYVSATARSTPFLSDFTQGFVWLAQGFALNGTGMSINPTGPGTGAARGVFEPVSIVPAGPGGAGIETGLAAGPVVGPRGLPNQGREVTAGGRAEIRAARPPIGFEIGYVDLVLPVPEAPRAGETSPGNPDAGRVAPEAKGPASTSPDNPGGIDGAEPQPAVPDSASVRPVPVPGDHGGTSAHTGRLDRTDEGGGNGNGNGNVRTEPGADRSASGTASAEAAPAGANDVPAGPGSGGQ